MHKLIDVVNLNADASCLSSEKWLKMLEGGIESYFYQWLKVYVDANKKISFGITGSTVSDIASFNPEAIDLINQHPNIFEIILRPYSHDIALMRSTQSFLFNLDTGMKVLNKEFKNVTPFYLPPEFMLTNEQVKLLADKNVQGTFINALRFKPEIRQRLPEHPYMVKGLFDSQLKCVPFESKLTSAYLNSIHFYDSTYWNAVFHQRKHDYYFSWRDGESSFFVPDGNYREATWLEGENEEIKRVFISEIINELAFDNNANLKENHYHYYPIHSFSAWMKEFRMLGFLGKLQDMENDVSSMSTDESALWLQLINSDILSAIEKDSPTIKIKTGKHTDEIIEHTIWRCERGMEGEEYLELLYQSKRNKNGGIYFNKSDNPHIKKIKSRVDYLKVIL